MDEEKNQRGFWGSLPGILTATAAVITAIAGLLVTTAKPNLPPGPGHVPPPVEKVLEMGPLREGLNLDGYDLKPEHWNVANAKQCSDMCLSEAKCKAMTYVTSNRSCWLKDRVPTPVADPKHDMISAVKQVR